MHVDRKEACSTPCCLFQIDYFVGVADLSRARYSVQVRLYTKPVKNLRLNIHRSIVRSIIHLHAWNSQRASLITQVFTFAMRSLSVPPHHPSQCNVLWHRNPPLLSSTTWYRHAHELHHRLLRSLLSQTVLVHFSCIFVGNG